MSTGLNINLEKVTEAAAIASYSWIGRGDKNMADQAAVSAMRQALNNLDISGEVVIGEGEIDNAPMLYIGEKVGLGGDKVDIAVDPIEGTRMTALGQANALSVIAVAKKGVLLKAPDMYMEKLVVNRDARDVIDIDKPLYDNICAVANKLNKPVKDVSVAILLKPRHEALISQLQKLGVKVVAFPDGDVIVSAQVCMPDNEIDIMYGIGGAPEGVISAAIAKALNGNMQAKLLPRYKVKGNSVTPCEISISEMNRCSEMGISCNEKLQLDKLVHGDDVVFSATGITDGNVLKGISVSNGITELESLVISTTNPRIYKTKSYYLQEATC
ncbi:class II fructose-bisphosphatase [Vibrio sp. JC009]|uniref:class II fructose-bisphosphatase n=1 Tax=Vibrio sp. JC009 TaxID=2912314 RepID=UPI0023B086F1|nr:class II fructose-bisphosphatase [Vibrio sp. JC009]WED24035.1 class II fructose-bisphosphatase [Vibrio sp. JC009]